MSDDIIETAKATQEVAKTTGKAIEASQKFGGFIAKYISGSLEQGMGIFEDKLKYMRWERQLRLIDKADDILRSRGLEQPTKPIPLKLAIPLLEAASLEDDNYLQNLWINLLVNASDSEMGIELKRTYIDILERITPLEGKILESIYSLSFKESHHKGIATENLPDVAKIITDETRKDIKEPSLEIKLALTSLSILGCISLGKTMGGGEVFTDINPTYLGKYFIEACESN